MAKKRQIPPVERVEDDQARFALSALKERLEDMDGIRGEQGTTVTTKQDLVNAGLVEIDSQGILSKKIEDEQVAFKDQTLLSLESSLVAITTVDVGIAGGIYTAVYAQQQTDLINECKAKINEVIATIRVGLFKQ